MNHLDGKDEKFILQLQEDMQETSNAAPAFFNRDINRLIGIIGKMSLKLDELKQVASGNDERMELLIKKHSGEDYDRVRLDALSEMVATAFNDSANIQTITALMAENTELRLKNVDLETKLILFGVEDFDGQNNFDIDQDQDPTE